MEQDEQVDHEYDTLDDSCNDIVEQVEVVQDDK